MANQSKYKAPAAAIGAAAVGEFAVGALAIGVTELAVWQSAEVLRLALDDEGLRRWAETEPMLEDSGKKPKRGAALQDDSRLGGITEDAHSSAWESSRASERVDRRDFVFAPSAADKSHHKNCSKRLISITLRHRQNRY